MSSHNVEHLPVCLRFVDKDCNISEEFKGFMKLELVRAVDITETITSSIENLGLSLCNLCGQGYDGPSTMAGEKAGVQARICESNQSYLHPLCWSFIEPSYIDYLCNSANQKLHRSHQGIHSLGKKLR